MKLLSLYEDAMNELIFDYDEDEDRVTISAIKNRETLGKIVLEMVFDAYREFEDAIEDPEIDFNDDDFNKIFPNERFTKIEHLDVIDKAKGSGIAKALMQKAISYARSNGDNVMYLNASPMGFKGLNIQDLTGFYKTFGFQTLIDSGHNVEMFMNI
jgi:GNAT superfamily N-acetyltransferase